MHSRPDQTPAADGSTNRPRVSVCMAAYNGVAFIGEQIQSILPQLYPDDELIVVDDHSSDDTVARVEEFADPRIRLLRSPRNRGYVLAFADAIAAADGEVIFLSDQDDLWCEGRVDRMLGALEDVDLVVSNFASFGGALTRVQSQRLRARDSARWRRNIFWIWVGTRPYYGCCMAFRARLREQLLPFPDYLTETHDQWIGYVANVNRSVRHLEEDTVARRVHSANASARGDRSLVRIVRARFMTGRCIVEAFSRRAGYAQWRPRAEHAP